MDIYALLRNDSYCKQAWKVKLKGCSLNLWTTRGLFVITPN